MATVSMRQSLSHWAMASKSGVLVPNRRTDGLSRSAGTQTKSSRAPMSMPAALGWIFSQCSLRAILLDFLFFPLESLLFMCLGGFSPRMKEDDTLLNGIAPHVTNAGCFTNDLLALLGTRLTYGHSGTIGEHGQDC